MEPPAQLGSARSALVLACWGAFVVGFDLKVNRLDLVNDIIGSLMVVTAMMRLSRIPGPRRFRTFARAALGAAVVCLIADVLSLGSGYPESWPAPLRLLLSLVWDAGMLSVCAAMIHLTIGYRAAISWRTTFVLVLVLLVLPHVLVGLFVLPSRGTIQVNGEPCLAIVVLAVLLTPYVHFLASVLRTPRSGEAASKPCRKCWYNRADVDDDAPCPLCEAPGQCPDCGYELVGLSGVGQCPECGRPIERPFTHPRGPAGPSRA